MDLELPDDFKEFLKLLNSYQVEYLLIGGYAVGYHGYPRATNDMDVWVAIHSDNAERLVDVLQAFGFSVLGPLPNIPCSRPGLNPLCIGLRDQGCACGGA